MSARLNRFGLIALAVQVAVVIISIALLLDSPVLTYALLAFGALIAWGVFATYAGKWSFASASATTGLVASAFTLASDPPFAVPMAMLVSSLGAGILGERVAMMKRLLSDTRPGEESTESYFMKAVNDMALSSLTLPLTVFATAVIITVLALNLQIGELSVPIAVILSIIVVISAGYSILSMRQAE